MSPEDITKFKLDTTHPTRMTRKELEGLDRMSDEEVEAAARTDPDAKPLSTPTLKSDGIIANKRCIYNILSRRWCNHNIDDLRHSPGIKWFSQAASLWKILPAGPDESRLPAEKIALPC